jgi:hypothetical protein
MSGPEGVPRPAMLIFAADQEAANRIYGLIADVLESDEGLVTLSAQSVDRPHLETALGAARSRAPWRHRLRLLH